MDGVRCGAPFDIGGEHAIVRMKMLMSVPSDNETRPMNKFSKLKHKEQALKSISMMTNWPMKG